MEASELFRSCANEHVAAAALICIGGGLVSRVDKAAMLEGLTRGALVARLVAEYDRKASPTMRKLLDRGMRRAEMPILAGLHHVLEATLNGVFDHAPRAFHPSQWGGPDLRWLMETTPAPAGAWRGLHS